MPTIKDIARECGVSANTVSSVLNNKPGEVSQATRLRVLETMRRLNYRPNAAARRMVGKRTYTVGIADRFTASSEIDPYKAQVLAPLIHEARRSRWDILYYAGHPSEGDAGGYPAFLDGRSDGLICFSGDIAQDEVQAILGTGLPVVFIGETHSGGGAVIDVDNEMGACLAVSHLTSLGHRRIAMMEGKGIAGNLDRVAGYRRALAQAGLPFDDRWLCPVTAWEGAAYARGLEILSLPPRERPTAIFCFNDSLALGLLRAAHDRGLRVPEDLSVVGFDDIIPAAYATPPLTTVWQPLALVGAKAVAMLIGIVEGQLPASAREIVQPQLVIRASTGPPAA
jgi:LacI family transcriptional regulator